MSAELDESGAAGPRMEEHAMHMRGEKEPAAAAGERVSLGQRAVLKSAAAVGGAFVLGFHLPLVRGAAPAVRRFEPNAFIRIDRQGLVSLVIPQDEMGQGIYTGLAMVLAEELV